MAARRAPGQIMISELSDNYPPAENLTAYNALYIIEVLMRELIVEELESIAGPFWYKSRLPADALKKYRNGLREERDTSWIHLIPHHPIYYTDFPHLRLTIERKDNWDDAFIELFGKKELLRAMLSELEMIRNRVAHSRRLHRSDTEYVIASLDKITMIIGEKRVVRLLARSQEFNDLQHELSRLRNEAMSSYQDISEMNALEGLPVWDEIRKSWWFEAEYLGAQLDWIEGYFSAADEYSLLPRSRGRGHEIEEWISQRQVQDIFNQAIKELDHLLGSWREIHELSHNA